MVIPANRVISGGLSALDALVHSNTNGASYSQMHQAYMNKLANTSQTAYQNTVRYNNELHQLHNDPTRKMLAKSVVHAAGRHLESNMIIPLTPRNMHDANPTTAMYIMSLPKIQKMHQRQVIVGYDSLGEYFDPGAVFSKGADGVMDSDWMEDNDLTTFSMDNDEVEDLDDMDKSAVNQNWDTAMAMVRNREDPTQFGRGI